MRRFTLLAAASVAGAALIGTVAEGDRKSRGGEYRPLGSDASFTTVHKNALGLEGLTAGTFFPLSGLPEWVQVLGQFNPLHHCVELVRHAAFGFEGWVDVGHVGALVVFAIATWRLAIHYMTKKLVD